MSDDRFPNIMAIFGVVDGLLGCVLGLLNLAFWAFVVILLISLVVGLVT